MTTQQRWALALIIVNVGISIREDGSWMGLFGTTFALVFALVFAFSQEDR